MRLSGELEILWEMGRNIQQVVEEREREGSLPSRSKSLVGFKKIANESKKLVFYEIL